MTDPAAALDKRQVRRNHARWCGVADSPAHIPAERLWGRLESMALAPRCAADVGGDGAFLSSCYPQARVTAVDFALPLLTARCGAGGRAAAVCADAEQLPLADGALQLLWSNLCVEWTDYRRFFGEAARVLEEGGLFAFTALGPDTLREMRQVFAGEARVHDFADMHDLGDALMAAGFAEPLLEAERLTFTYAAAADALSEARRLGAGNARAVRHPLTRARWRQAQADYANAFADEAGRVHATYEVVYATAWRAAARTGAGVGESPVRFY